MSHPTNVFLRRKLDKDEYSVGVRWTEPGKFTLEKPHHFLLRPTAGKLLNVTLAFSSVSDVALPDVARTHTASEQKWKRFWTDGAAVDFSGSSDPRAKELERRIVLSQYLTAIQCSGSTPPQETGLTCNSWYGKFHLEMHWWHAAHFALWNRFPMLEKSLDYYRRILPSARQRARQQGYYGARWPKMTAPDGRDSPSPIGPLLIWQQPHPIFYAELAYLIRPTTETLAKYKTIVEETADFMAAYARLDPKRGAVILGPPVIPAQENHPPRETWNPTFELEYWHFGLKTAQKWRERLGLERDPKWDDVIKWLSPLSVKDGVYLAHENCPQTFTERNKDHPSMLGALGILTGEKVDRETMRRTLKKVMKEWDWPETWGWDYPMVAMTAARLGELAIAIDALLLDTPKNHYAANGHNYQRPNLPLYLPGNGGLLYAIALMANGWKDGPKANAPGFPADGSWTVHAEGFNADLFREI
ncbi:MAG: glycoside hydrolase family 65, partial [Acidobacteriota bacterium]